MTVIEYTSSTCHKHCGCNSTPYRGCCLDCPLEECYFVSGEISDRDRKLLDSGVIILFRKTSNVK